MDDMKHWYVTGPGRLEVADERVPIPGEGEVLIRMHYTALSPGSNLHVYLHGSYGGSDRERADVVYMGSGRIEDVGPGVSRERIGERVAFNGLGHQELGVVPARQAHRVPDSVGLDAASLSYLPAWSVSALHLGQYAAAETVVVVGLGLVGASAALVADAAGARLLALDVDDQRRTLAKRLSLGKVEDPLDPERSEAIRAYLTEAGADLIIETSGSWSGFRTAMNLARDYSRIALMGMYREPPPEEIAAILHREMFGFPSKMHYQRIQIIGCGSDPDCMPEPMPRSATRSRNFRWVLEQAGRGRLNLSSLVTSIVPADYIEKELKRLAAGDTSHLGIVFDWGRHDQ